MNTIKVITELSPDDRLLLESLLGAIGTLTSVIGSTLPPTIQPQVIAEITGSAPATTEETPAEPTPDPEPVIETPAPVADPEPDVKPVSLAEFQKAVTLAVSKGADAKKTAKEIINKYAPSVSEVPEDKRAEVMAELSKI